MPKIVMTWKLKFKTRSIQNKQLLFKAHKYHTRRTFPAVQTIFQFIPVSVRQKPWLSAQVVWPMLHSWLWEADTDPFQTRTVKIAPFFHLNQQQQRDFFPLFLLLCVSDLRLGSARPVSNWQDGISSALQRGMAVFEELSGEGREGGEICTPTLAPSLLWGHMLGGHR